VSVVLWLVIYREDRKGELTFAVLNVGQGDALFLESPSGKQIIIDGGPDRNLLSELPKVLPWYDKHIDMIVVTNPDLDHYSGFLSLLNKNSKYKVDYVLEPGTLSKTETYAILEKEIEDKNIKKILARRGQVIDIGGRAFLEILFPDRDVTNLSSNDGSIVMKLVYGNTSIMLQGDSTSRIEEYLVSLNNESEIENLSSNILKVGHHGSRTSSSETYVESVDPEYAVISSGVNNKFGHPHKEVLETLEKNKVKILDTCEMGTIIFKSDGNQFALKNKKIIPVTAGCKK
jgi:competence protein ComEC